MADDYCIHEQLLMQKKCECYWPENLNSTFEPGQGISVVLTSMTPFTEYTFRKLVVTKVSGQKKITIMFIIAIVL